MKRSNRNRPNTLGFTGTIGGSLSDRPRRTALTGDERDSLHGASCVVEPTPTRNLRAAKHPRHEPVSRAITVTRGSLVYRVTSRLAPIGGTHTVDDKPSKRAMLATGAVYGDSWQRSVDADNVGEHVKPTAESVEARIASGLARIDAMIAANEERAR